MSYSDRKHRSTNHAPRKAKLLLQLNLSVTTLVDLKALDSTKFHSLCNALVKAEYSDATCVEGSGGDEGIDCFLGNNMDADNLHVFQHKFLPTTLNNSGKGQIKSSLKQVISKHPNVSRWTLVIAKDLTPEEIKWFNQLKIDYPNIKLDLWDNTKLKDLLRKYPTIRYDYFPIPEHIDKKITKHLDDLKEMADRLLDYVQDESSNRISPTLNNGLYEDLISNHYPDLGTKLQKLLSLLDNIESQSCKFISQIKSLLKHNLVNEGIKYRYDESGTYDMIDSIPINQFAERLWLLMESSTYSDDRFWLNDGYPTMVRIVLVTDLGQGVMYQCLPNENCKEIKSKLQSICRMIIHETNEKLSQYNELKSARNMLTQNLSQELEGIRYTYQLPFESIDGRCKYINY